MRFLQQGDDPTADLSVATRHADTRRERDRCTTDQIDEHGGVTFGMFVTDGAQDGGIAGFLAVGPPLVHRHPRQRIEPVQRGGDGPQPIDRDITAAHMRQFMQEGEANLRAGG